MRIPDRLRIGGQTYEVRIVDRIIDSQGACGRIIPEMGVIEIQDAPSESFMMITLLHELTHAVLDHMGLHDDERFGEGFVDGFANAWYMVARQNRGMFMT